MKTLSRILLVTTITLLAGTANAAEWWGLDWGPDMQHFSDPMTVCKIKHPTSTPASMYLLTKDQGQKPRIEDKGDRVIVHFTVFKQDPIDGAPGDYFLVYFRTQAACEIEAKANKEKAQAEKQAEKAYLEKYR